MGGAVLKPSSKYIYDEAVTRIQAAFDHYDKDSNGEIDKDVSQSRLALYNRGRPSYMWHSISQPSHCLWLSHVQPTH